MTQYTIENALSRRHDHRSTYLGRDRRMRALTFRSKNDLEQSLSRYTASRFKRMSDRAKNESQGTAQRLILAAHFLDKVLDRFRTVTRVGHVASVFLQLRIINWIGGKNIRGSEIVRGNKPIAGRSEEHTSELQPRGL